MSISDYNEKSFRGEKFDKKVKQLHTKALEGMKLHE
jgi:hypothetical protein